MNAADEKVARFVLKDFREGIVDRCPANARHLAACPDAKAMHVEGEDGTYGCDTGCEYARLTAQIECPHGMSYEHEYGDFGEIADILAEIEAEYG